LTYKAPFFNFYKLKLYIFTVFGETIATFDHNTPFCPFLNKIYTPPKKPEFRVNISLEHGIGSAVMGNVGKLSRAF